MAMREPEDLMQISEVIYKQLIGLGFINVRNVQIAIDNDEKKVYSGVEYSEYYQNRFKDSQYDVSPVFNEIVKEIKKSHTAFYQKEIRISIQSKIESDQPMILPPKVQRYCQAKMFSL